MCRVRTGHVQTRVGEQARSCRERRRLREHRDFRGVRGPADRRKCYVSRLFRSNYSTLIPVF
jgi:hypothetical protein